MSAPPPPPKPPSPEKRPGSFLTVALAAMLGLVLLLGFSSLLIMIMGPFGVALLLVAGLIFAAVVVHYVVWGWWLSGIIRREAELDEESPPSP